MLRIEVVVHNTQELQCGRSLEKFPQIVVQAKEILERFMNALSCIDQCFIADSMLEELPTPSRVGKTKVGGIDLNKASHALGSRGRHCSCVYRHHRKDLRLRSWPVRSGCSVTRPNRTMVPRRAAYDLKKLRGKKIVQRIGQTRRYRINR